MTSQPPSVQTTNSSHLGESTSGWREVVTPKPAEGAVTKLGFPGALHENLG